MNKTFLEHYQYSLPTCSFQDCWLQSPSAEHPSSNTGSTLPYPCSYCPQGFKKGHDLIRHERIHTGENPFICIYCSFSSPRKGTLKSHCKKIHKMSDDEFESKVGSLYVGILGWYILSKKQNYCYSMVFSGPFSCIKNTKMLEKNLCQ